MSTLICGRHPFVPWWRLRVVLHASAKARTGQSVWSSHDGHGATRIYSRGQGGTLSFLEHTVLDD